MINLLELTNLVDVEINEILDLIYKELRDNSFNYKYSFLIANENEYLIVPGDNEDEEIKEVFTGSHVRILTINMDIALNLTLDDLNLNIDNYDELYRKYLDEYIEKASLIKLLDDSLQKNIGPKDIYIIGRFIDDYPNLTQKIVQDNFELLWDIKLKEDCRKNIMNTIMDL